MSILMAVWVQCCTYIGAWTW